MKKSVVYLILCTSAACLCGCTTMRFSEYTGHDASSYLGTWPIGPGTMAEGAHGGGFFTSGLEVPVYRGWPERYYLVLGSIRFEDPNKSWGNDEGLLKAAASEAKRHHADAIVIRQGAEYGVSKIAGGKNDPLVLSSSFQTTALAIRWLTPKEIMDRDLLLDEFLKRFSANDPPVWANRSIAALVVTYLLQTGIDLKSPQLFDRFQETMSSLVTRVPDNLAGDWLFKATVSFSTVLSGGDEKNSLGVATISTDGENLTIVSSGGTTELNFSGMVAKGRVTGQIGIGSISAKCEGAATPDKISINFQSLTPDGTVSGNVVLQRLPLKPKTNEKAKPNSPDRST